MHISRLLPPQREKFEVLLREERLLDRDIQQFDARLQTWDLKLNSPKSKKAPATRQHQTNGALKSKRTRSMLTKPKPQTSMSRAEKRLAAIDAEIAHSGGRSGGWDNRDHTLFVKLLRKHHLDDDRVRAKRPNLENFFDEVTSAVPHLVQMEQVQPGSGHEQCQRHYEWYQHYCLLAEEKKTLIRTWREEKDAPAKKEEEERAAQEAQAAKEEERARKERQRRARIKQRRKREQVQV